MAMSQSRSDDFQEDYKQQRLTLSVISLLSLPFSIINNTFFFTMSIWYSWFPSFSYLFLFACICTNHAFSDDSYSKHCSTVIPPHNSTSRSSGDYLPFLSTPYFTGGGTLLRMEPGRTYYYVQKNLKLRLRPYYYQTTAAGVYKVGGSLYIRSPYTSDDAHANFSYGGYNSHRSRANGSIKFPMDGFWSENSRKLCMVGSASWRGIHRHAVLKLKFHDSENPTIYTAAVSGSLESTASPDALPYFAPILILNFPEASNYKYSLVAKEIGGVFPSPKNESVSIDAIEFCSVMRRGLMALEYAAECTGSHHCSPLGDGDGFMPAFLSLTSIQCLEGSKKARFIAEFQNYSSYDYNSFTLGSTLIGEASWDDESNRVIGMACEILDPSHKLGDVVGKCTTRLIMRYPSVLTLRNGAKIVGKIWSSKANLRQINLTSSGGGRVMELAEQRYEYTEVDRARKCCTKKAAAKKKGDVYPDGQSYDMRLDMNIKNGKGEEVAWASATPVWVGNESYYHRGGWGDTVLESSETVSYAVSEAAVEKLDTTSSPTKISYKIMINTHFHANSSNSNISSLDWPVSPHGGVVITAEGLYDAANGHLCMVGCRRLLPKVDCQVVMEFNLPPLNRKRGGLTKGVLRSTRPRTDPLHFDDLILQSYAYYRGEAERSIWRMDLEMAMVLISNTLVCIFVALQIFHVKRSPEVLSSVSLVMLVVLSVGHMIPLVLNFEAVFLGNREKSTVELGSGGKLEANEIAVRVITMVALLLQLRLFQLVWATKQNEKNSWSGEKKAGFASLTLYVLGGLLTILLNWLRKKYILGWRYSVWGDLRSYAGLVLDGFLVPQILLNVWRGSAEKALSHPFYVGTSVVRLVPHAYNQYRAHNYPKFDLNATYYYANPAGDMYSTAWDIIIPCGIMALAVIVFVQQRYGGRCIFPKRLMRGFEMYEKVPTTDNQ